MHDPYSNRLRLGEELSADELNWFAGGLASGAVSDAQAGAFAMAAVSKGLGPMGRVALDPCDARQR